MRIGRFNEEAIWDVWLRNKNMMYMSPSYKEIYFDRDKKFDKDECLVGLSLSGYENPDFKQAKKKVIDRINLGVFYKKEYYGQYSVGFSSFLYRGSTYFDLSQTFDILMERTKKLGFVIGSNVYVKPLKENKKIVKIHNGVIYSLKGSGIYENNKYLSTLFYEVEGDNNLYQVTHLEKVEKTQELGIGDSIGDNFIDLIDDEKIYLITQSRKSKDKEVYYTNIETVGKAKIELISEIFSELEQTKIRLRSQEGMETKIEKIEFKEGKLYLTFSNKEISEN
jgi:hypothetical protein